MLMSMYCEHNVFNEGTYCVDIQSLEMYVYHSSFNASALSLNVDFDFVRANFWHISKTAQDRRAGYARSCDVKF
jgi:hypothetical protein